MATKKYSYIGISFIILVFGIWAIPNIIDRVDSQKENQLAIIGQSPSFELTNQNGETISSEDYKDKVYVLEFFFTSCPNICIKMNKSMMKLQKYFATDHRFAIASITIDPARDTIAKLKKYADKHNASGNWNFLTGEQENIYEIAQKGFNLYINGNASKEVGGFEHSGMFALIDQKGMIRSRKDSQENPIIYYDGTDTEQIKLLKKDIQILLN